MQKIGIFYGSSTGNTKYAAKQMQLLLGKDSSQIFDVVDAKATNLEQFINIIFGASTWGISDIQDDFEEFMSEIDSVNLEGKKIAIFGFGDQKTYPETFVDAIGQIYEAIVNKGCDIVGKISTDGYEYGKSMAEVDGQFVGLPLDEKNQSDLTDDRIRSWIEQLKYEFK